MSRKYILVTGGVISGVGKGVIASSLGAILKCCGIEVTAIKIDPYINLDAGTFSPYEHGIAKKNVIFKNLVVLESLPDFQHVVLYAFLHSYLTHENHNSDQIYGFIKNF